jgi:hypothetical protein
VDLPAQALPRFPEPSSGWRRAALLAAAVAALELVALVVVALAFIAKPFADEPAAQKPAEPARVAQESSGKEGPGAEKATAPVRAERSRAETRVLVLNGNGISGAAGMKADVIERFRYQVAGVSDAARRDFPRTVVMYRSGFRGEGERLADDLGLAGGRAMPLDGMRPADLGGAQLVVIVGNEP